MKTKIFQKLYYDANVSNHTALFHYGMGILTAVASNVNIKKGSVVFLTKRSEKFSRLSKVVLPDEHGIYQIHGYRAQIARTKEWSQYKS